MEAPPSAPCYICEMFTSFYDFGMQYGQDIYKALLPPSRILFISYVSAWVAWYLVFKGVFKGTFDARYFIKKLVLFTFVESLLEGSDFFWTYIQSPFLALISGLAQKIITLGKIPMKTPTFEGVLYMVDSSLNKTVFQLWKILIGEGGWMSWKPIVAGIILIIPYLLVVCLFLAFMLEFVFAMVLITALCPLLYMGLCFKFSRGISLSALRIALHGALTLIFSAISMGLTIEVFHKFAPLIPVKSEGVSSQISDFIFSSQYWAIWILGFLCAFFHMRAAYFAKQISQFSYKSSLSSSVSDVGNSFSLRASEKQSRF